MLVMLVTSTAHANSCGNINVIGAYDQSGLRESEFGIYAVGTFRIAKEEDESNQPMFNLAQMNCEKQIVDGKAGNFECTITKAVVYAKSGNPDANDPNCSLDLDMATFSMKELQKGILTGIATETSACYNTILTIDQNAKRVYLAFTKTKEADHFDKIKPGTCSKLPPTEVMMNCTGWPKIRRHLQTPARYCDFSSSSDK